jgi:acyl-CoA thioester hydrolase
LELDPPLGFAVRKFSAEYLIPARIDNALVIVTRFDPARGARFNVTQSVLRREEILLTAEVEAVCIDLEGRPKRLPKSVLSALDSVSMAAI